LADTTCAQRRRYTRLSVRLELTWKARRPGESLNQPAHQALTRDVSSGGVCFPVPAGALEPGTYVILVLHGPEGSDTSVPLEGVVSWTTPQDDDLHLVGVRLLTPPEDGLHGLLLEAYEYVGEFSCRCQDVRFCGGLKNDCPAYKQGRNCWQISDAPCCYWTAGEDTCGDCPISILCFLD